MSQISFLRAGLSEPGFSHMPSLRRQIFIKPEDADKLPPPLNIFYEDTSFWIYLSGDNINCYLCKKEGYLSKGCPDSTNKETENSINAPILSMPIQRATSRNQSPQLNCTSGITRLSQILNNDPQMETTLSYNSSKRPLSESSSQSTQKIVLEEDATDSSLMDVEDSTHEISPTLPLARKQIKKKTKMTKIVDADEKALKKW